MRKARLKTGGWNWSNNSMREININNISVSYTDEGRKDSSFIIFIHGFPFNKSMWNSQVASLKDNYRPITYDIRGHGHSTAGNEVFSIDLFVNDLISFMDTLKIDKAILCGLSMGGYIALNAIGKHNDRFDALILSDTQCMADTAEAKEKRMKAIENIRKNGVEKYADESVKNLFALGSFTTRVKEIADIREMIMKTSEQSLCNTLIALSVRKETCAKLSAINVPVLIMVGSEDKITPPEAARFMHEKIKGSLLKIIDHAGHLSNLENPDEFNLQLKNFVASVYQGTIL
jgi:3-oxoadipate enol-lactonase